MKPVMVGCRAGDRGRYLGVDIGLAHAFAAATEAGDIEELGSRFGAMPIGAVGEVVVDIAKEHGLFIALERLGHDRRRRVRRNGGIDPSTMGKLLAVRNSILRAAQVHGVGVAYVQAKGTSRVCAKCGWCDGFSRDLLMRQQFECKRCGHLDHADLNAARNIAKRAEIRGPRAAKIPVPRKSRGAHPWRRKAQTKVSKAEAKRQEADAFSEARKQRARGGLPRW